MIDHFSHSPTNPTPGGTVQICYTNASMTDQSITIEIEDPTTNEIVEEHIDLDENGHGCVEWSIPEKFASAIVSFGSEEHGIVFAA